MDGIIHEAMKVEGPVRLSRLEIQQRSAALQIERHRNLVVRDEPVAVNLPKARRRPKPEIGPVPVLQGAAYPIEAVPKCDIITHGDGEVANLVTSGCWYIAKASTQFFLFASAPTCCSGGTMSNDTISGA
jgi:hypothetical protein